MLKRVQHDRKKCVIPNLFRNLDFGNDNKLIAFVSISKEGSFGMIGKRFFVLPAALSFPLQPSLPKVPDQPSILEQILHEGGDGVCMKFLILREV
jgi:hypothetical protein